MEDTLGALKGQFDVAGMKNCRRRRGAEVGRQLLGHSGGLGRVSAEAGISQGQTPPKEKIWLLLDGEAPHWW